MRSALSQLLAAGRSAKDTTSSGIEISRRATCSRRPSAEFAASTSKSRRNLSVGYVMGIGDDVPSAISQLGARVQLLSESDSANGNLQSFDAIMTGTRAYAVRW